MNLSLSFVAPAFVLHSIEKSVADKAFVNSSVCNIISMMTVGLFVLSMLMLMLMGCGQKGSLYLPSQANGDTEFILHAPSPPTPKPQNLASYSDTAVDEAMDTPKVAKTQDY